MSTSVLSVVVLSLFLAGTIDAAPYQELEPRDGYVPVYIRQGDTPLIEINPKLAEAFNEIDTKNLLEADGESEKKPDLVVMSIDDDGDAMVITKPDDQVLSDDTPVESNSAEQEEEKETSDSEDDANIDKDDEVETPEAPEETTKRNSQQLAEAQEAMKELVNVFETEMLEKLAMSATEESLEEANEPKITEDEPEKMDDAEDLNDDDHKIIDDDKLEEAIATDVSTVDAFRTKEIDVKSIETEMIDVPEEDASEDTDE